MRNWLSSDSAEQVDVLNNPENLVWGGSDPKSKPIIATHTTNIIAATYTTNGIPTRKLYPLFIKPAIQAVKMRSRASCGSPNFVATSVSPTRIGNQDIIIPSNSITARRGSNNEPFNVSINQFSAVNGHSTSHFSGVSGAETVSTEVAHVNPCERVGWK